MDWPNYLWLTRTSRSTDFRVWYFGLLEFHSILKLFTLFILIYYFIADIQTPDSFAYAPLCLISRSFLFLKVTTEGNENDFYLFMQLYLLNAKWCHSKPTTDRKWFCFFISIILIRSSTVNEVGTFIASIPFGVELDRFIYSRMFAAWKLLVDFDHIYSYRTFCWINTQKRRAEEKSVRTRETHRTFIITCVIFLYQKNCCFFFIIFMSQPNYTRSLWITTD